MASRTLEWPILVMIIPGLIPILVMVSRMTPQLIFLPIGSLCNVRYLRWPGMTDYICIPPQHHKFLASLMQVSVFKTCQAWLRPVN